LDQTGFLSSTPLPEDANWDNALRPRSLKEFVGQESVRRNLEIYIEAAKARKEPLDHILFSGPPGLGKTTLSFIIATELGAQIKVTSGPVLDKPGDLAGILTNLARGHILFIDEVHRLRPAVEEYLYSAMEDFSINFVIDKGPNARSVKVDLQRFTLIGATTREGLLTAPLRARFGVMEKLRFYEPPELKRIVQNAAARLSFEIETAAAELIANRSRGTPRVANRFLRRIRDVAQVIGQGRFTRDVAEEGLRMMGIDEIGLCGTDREILETLARVSGPVGLKTLAVAVGEEEHTIEDVYEPFLIQAGFLERTPRGRVITEHARETLGYPAPSRRKPRGSATSEQ
jgi:Holliday junction DNA helicase RuvB